MSVFITGDIHGDYDIGKLESKFFNNDNELGLTKDDYLVICGDFGLVWNDEYEDMCEQLLDWLDGKPWTTLFVDGNHEGFELLNAYPVEEWNGGKVHRIRDGIIHLMRGQVFDIDNEKFFTMGGAKSHDKHRRVEGRSWWPEEIPNDAEREEAMKNLDKHGWKVDYVITHEAPGQIAENLIYRNRDDSREVDEFSSWLGEIAFKLDFKRWFHGHHHTDFAWENGKYCSMYDWICNVDNINENLCKYNRFSGWLSLWPF